MHRLHIHTHKIDWHSARIHLGHWIHDPRFWGIFGLIILFILMILSLVLSKPGVNPSGSPRIPMYPHIPY